MRTVVLNPKTKRAGDCVIQAIALANDQGWLETYDDLCKIGRSKYDLPNSKKVYEAYLDSLGWEKMRQPRKRNGLKYKVDEFVYMVEDSAIVTVAGHMTYIEDGELVDRWDCGYKTVLNYWVKRK